MISPAPTASRYILKVYTRKPCVSSRRGRRGSSPPDGSRTSTGQFQPLPTNCPEHFFFFFLDQLVAPLTPASGTTFDRRHTITLTSRGSDSQACHNARGKMSPDGISDVWKSVGLRGCRNRRAEPRPTGGKRSHVTHPHISVGVRDEGK